MLRLQHSLKLYILLIYKHSGHPIFSNPYIPIVCKELSAMVKAEDQEGKPVWDKPVDVDEKWIQFVDDNVIASEPLAAWRK